jgi:hypothetical protein
MGAGMADELAHKRREAEFRASALEAFAFLEPTYGLSLSEQRWWGCVWFASDRVGLLVGTHLGEIDVGFKLKPEPAGEYIPGVEFFLADVLRLTGPGVTSICPCFEESDLRAQLQRIAAQVAEYCEPVLRGDAEAFRRVQELQHEAAVTYTRRFNHRDR